MTPDVVQVIWSTPVAAASMLLTAEESLRLARLHHQADRDRSATGRALLRIAVARVLDVEPGAVRIDATCACCGGSHGQPRVTAPSSTPRLDVSVAHAADRVLVAVSAAGPIGIDIEPEDAAGFPGFDQIGLTERERREIDGLAAADQTRARTAKWVQKEAMLKLDGRGLTVSPAAVDTRDAQLIAVDAGAGYTAWLAVRARTDPCVVIDDGRPWLARQAATARTATP